ncbi:hypothetical protein IPJ72_01900 [Candidatus Peregrinibacteria bacterium]|nr:MAG: hypothetical protein IPJ72_01900 [Candidatus Peregrinibacteria bacterium]
MNDANIDVVNYSTDQVWGNLPETLVDQLRAAGYRSLDQVAADAGYDPGLGNQTALVDALVDEGFLNEDIQLIIDEIRFRGESQINTILIAVVRTVRNLLGVFGILFIVISGIQLVTSGGDESKITEGRTAILYVVIGLVVVLLLERLVTLIFGVPGQERGISGDQIVLIDAEVLGIISFVRALVGGIALLMILISAVRMIFAQGADDEIKKQRTSVIWVVVGIILLVINQFVIENIFIAPVRQNSDQITITNVQNIINLFGTMMEFFLGFVGVVAFGILVYGGASLIMNYSNDDMVDRAKKIITNALIGIVIIVTAFAIVSTLVTFQ